MTRGSPDPNSIVTVEAACSTNIGKGPTSDSRGDWRPKASFGVDTYLIGIDNRCSAAISHCVSDFVGKLTTCNDKIKGYGGTTNSRIMRGTLKWKIEDDKGQTHTFKLPDSVYYQEGDERLMSPQHWAQAMHQKGDENTTLTTGHSNIYLQWGDNKYKKKSLSTPQRTWDDEVRTNDARILRIHRDNQPKG